MRLSRLIGRYIEAYSEYVKKVRSSDITFKCKDRVRCIDTAWWSTLELGKEYIVTDSIVSYGSSWITIKGDHTIYAANRFELVTGHTRDYYLGFMIKQAKQVIRVFENYLRRHYDKT